METEALELLESMRNTHSDMAQREPPSTLAGYLTWPEEPPYYEFINGVATRMPGPTLQHQILIKKLSRFFDDFVEERSLGLVVFSPIDVHLNEKQYLQPDIVFVAKENSSILKKHIQGAPDLVVEILSPSNAYNDIMLKKSVYKEFGFENTGLWIQKHAA